MSDTTQRTRDRAYQIWEERGRPEGQEVEHWMQAERELYEGLDAEGGTSRGMAGTDQAESAAATTASELDEAADTEDMAPSQRG
jgi:hypothetical protein